MSILSFIIFTIASAQGQEVKANSTSTLSPLELITNCIKQAHPNAQTYGAGSAEYDAHNYQWNMYKQVTPLGFFEPANVQEIQTVVKCSKSSKVPIVVRGGGHSYEKYSYGTGSELIIDLQQHNQITVDQQNKIAEVKAGALLGKVYYQLNQQGGFGFPAGTCLTVGFSGHVLGGGYGVSARKHGLATDTVTEIGIVTPDGNYQVASQTQNSDLFWALRGGGGGQFGIVTHFKVKVFKPPQAVKVLRLEWNVTDFTTAFNGFQNWAASNPDPAVTALVFSNKDTFKFTAVVQADTEAQSKAIFDQINAHLPQKRKVEELLTKTYWETVKHFSAPFSSDDHINNVKHSDMGKFYLHAKSGYVDRKLSPSEIQKWINTISQAPSTYYILLDVQGGAINNLSRTQTAFVHRQKSLYSVQLVNESTVQKEGEDNEAWADYWTSQVGYFLNGEAYQNYIDSRETNLGSYYAENLVKLREVKKKYDPSSLFKHAQSVPPS